MDSSLFFLVFVLPVYFLWSYWRGIVKRGEVAGIVDDYLGGDAPEHMKRIVYHFFVKSISHTFPFHLLVAYFTKSNEADRMVRKINAEHGTDAARDMNDVLQKLLMVNIACSPLSYAFCAIVLVLVSIVVIKPLKVLRLRIQNAFFRVIY